MTETLRPGLLVSLKTSVTGNVRYQKETIEAEHKTEDGTAIAAWKTQRTTTDPEEHEAAQRTREKSQSLIRGVCIKSAFGLLCPEDKEADLDKATEEARKLVDAFNATAKLTRVSVYLIKGRIAADDVQAVKAINSELADLMAMMQAGMAKLDVTAIRSVANKAKQVANMVTGEQQTRALIAIETAREFAKKIVAAGEAGSIEVDKIAIDKITNLRTSFLDFDPAGKIGDVTAEGVALDLTPVRNDPKNGYQPEAPVLELD